MAGVIKTPTELLASFPSARITAGNVSRPLADSGVIADEGPADWQALQNFIVTAYKDSVSRALTRVLKDDDTGLITAAPTTPQTIALYYVNVSAGELLCGGVYLRQAAQVDLDLLTIGYQLDGTAAAAISADGDALYVALCVLNVAGVPTFKAVFGAQANQGSEVAPTDAQIAAALLAAGIANADESSILVVASLLIDRNAVDTIVYTHDDPATDDTLAARRSVGSAHNPVT